MVEMKGGLNITMEILKYIGMMGIILISIMCLVITLAVVPDIIIEKINDKKEKKKEKDYRKQGIEKRWAVMGYGFYIFKVKDSDVFYLNKDGNFYNTTVNIQEYNFDTEKELNKYLEDNIENFKEKYGDIKFEKYKRNIYLGYCKQI